MKLNGRTFLHQLPSDPIHGVYAKQTLDNGLHLELSNGAGLYRAYIEGVELMILGGMVTEADFTAHVLQEYSGNAGKGREVAQLRDRRDKAWNMVLKCGTETHELDRILQNLAA